MKTNTTALSNKVAVITGGGGILCGAMARALGGDGVKVAILNRTASKGETVAQEIREAGGEAIALAANVLDRASLEAARDEVKRRWGGCDILLNGAGGNHPRGTTATETWEGAAKSAVTTGPGSFLDLDEAGFRAVFDLNFMGTLLPTQVFLPLLLGRPGATVINVSSMGAYRPMTKVPAYCAAKAALNNLTNWMAVHFAEAGLRVNAIAPGFFSTEQNKALLWNADGTPTARAKKIVDHTPMRRFGRPEELLGALRWLCDDKASGFVTGAVIPVDGGFSAYSGV
ncbi:MAG TPA: SDR family oxidoreductase [Opitutaceae bacterium]|nr:SDR family oxidoreductase [Opitutaceae bacterium]